MNLEKAQMDDYAKLKQMGEQNPVKQIGDEFRPLPLTDIHTDDSFNCRGSISPIELTTLMRDIKEHGVIQPVLVTPTTEEYRKKHGVTCNYRLVAGFRRMHSCRLLNMPEIPCMIKVGLTEARIIAINLSENLKRENLNMVQEARSVNRLYIEGLTEEDAARMIGVTRGWLQIRFMILKLPTVLQDEIAAGYYNQNQVRELYQLRGDVTKQMMYAKKIKESKERGDKVAVVLPKKRNIRAAVKRSPAEMNQMLDYLALEKNLPKTVANLSLAWAAGNISTMDFLGDLRAHYQTLGFEPNFSDFEAYGQKSFEQGIADAGIESSQ